MPNVSCFLADLNTSAYPQISDALVLGGKQLVEYFNAASILPRGNPAISLILDPSLRHNLKPNPLPGVSDSDLQDALSQIMAAVPAGGQPSVALILADSYKPNPDVFGFMFDLDWETPTYGPRQGCAVFLEKIYTTIKNAGKSDQDFLNLTAYVACHELAHAFNLWHVQNPPSFLFPWPPDDFMSACSFVPDEMTYLTHAADTTSAKYVLPGGSNFDCRGTIGPASTDGSYLAPKEAPKLSLKIRLKEKRFYNFESVELDVRLALENPDGENAEIPDQINPGYETCAIWITRPNGERFRFRPSIRFCSNRKSKTITPRNPFECDIPIFRHKGDYTFATAGIHEVYMTVKLSTKTTLTSNIVRFDILKTNTESRVFREMKEALMLPETVKLLRYKTRLPSAATYERLKKFTRGFPLTASAGTLHYSLGIAFLLSAHSSKDKTDSSRLHKLAKMHLRSAEIHPGIGKHRRKRIAQLLNPRS